MKKGSVPNCPILGSYLRRNMINLVFNVENSDSSLKIVDINKQTLQPCEYAAVYRNDAISIKLHKYDLIFLRKVMHGYKILKR